MERDNLIEQAQALNAAVAVIKEYCDGRTADDACRKCLFRDNCGGEPYTWGNVAKSATGQSRSPVQTTTSGRNWRDNPCRLTRGAPPSNTGTR